MLVGYIRVSTDDQNLNLQKDALIKYGIDQRNIFSDKTSGSKDKRVGLDKAIEFLKRCRKTDVLCQVLNAPSYSIFVMIV